MGSELIPKSLPILKIKAKNNYDVGYKIGQTFKDAINLQNDGVNIEKLEKFYNSERGKTIFDEYVTKTTEAFPDIVDEIKGMADGSGMSFDMLFLNCMSNEVLFLMDLMESEEAVVAPDGTVEVPEEIRVEAELGREVAGCTDVLVNTDQFKLLAHNEDWSTDVSGHAFLIDVDLQREESERKHIDENSSIRDILSSRDERFVGFVFPGELAGNTFSMNQHFAFTVNTLVPRRFNQGSVILIVLLRALMRCRTIEECEQVMKLEPYGCSYGININVASLKSSDMWSIEVYTDEDETMVDLLHIPKQPHDEDDSQHYVHTNHYKHIDDVDEMQGLEGSKAREEVASSVPTPSCIEDVCEILGDRSSDIQPIYRLPTETKQVVTAATAMFHFKKKQLLIYHGNPAEENTPKTIVPFIK